MRCVLTLCIIVIALTGIICAFVNDNDVGSSNVLLGILSILVFIHFLVFHLYVESSNSIINTYCTKYYKNNVQQYNECKYGHKSNFSKVIVKGLK